MTLLPTPDKSTYAEEMCLGGNVEDLEMDPKVYWCLHWKTGLCLTQALVFPALGAGGLSWIWVCVSVLVWESLNAKSELLYLLMCVCKIGGKDPCRVARLDIKRNSLYF